MINNSLPKEGWNELDVYRATQCSWKIGSVAMERAVYALGVSHGVVRGAFRIEGWRSAPCDRWCFDGRTAHELNEIVGTSFARMKAPQGQANPVRYFPDGIPPLDRE